MAWTHKLIICRYPHCHQRKINQPVLVLNGVNKLTLQTNEHGQYTHDAILLLQKGIGRVLLISQFNGSKTIQLAQRLESTEWDEGFRIKAFHLNNRFFAAANFQEHCKQQQQWFSFSGVGAKHQNGIVEQNTKTVAQWACANMLNLATHWPAEDHKRYWPQAIGYAVWVFNHLPNSTSGILPNKLWSRVQHVDNKLHCAHVFRCPVYVLDVSLQDGKKISKWNPWACLGLFLAFSDLHSSLVPLVLNVHLARRWLPPLCLRYLTKKSVDFCFLGMMSSLLYFLQSPK